MKPLIFVVDDNPDILFYLQNILEYENYDVITASNGKEALDKLSHFNKIPNLILSDIMMPKMNGYEFFENVSENHNINHIPFIFLTALNNLKDIRFGKMLGVDDYITKPFEKKDLLAVISGKLSKYNKIEQFNKSLAMTIDGELSPISNRSTKNEITNIIIVFWDDQVGPKLENFYPPDIDSSFSIKKTSIQLYMAANSIYGDDNFVQAEGLLLNIKNINKNGYIFFDCYPDLDSRGGYRDYMLGVLAPKINYFQSLKIKEILINLSDKIKQKEQFELLDYWKLVSKLV